MSPALRTFLTDKLTRIKALAENPHWRSDRKHRIAEIADEVLKELHPPYEPPSGPDGDGLDFNDPARHGE